MQSREAIQQRLDDFKREHGDWVTNIALPHGLRTSEGSLSRRLRLHRIVQVLNDLLPKPFSECRILDLGCLEGQFSLEFALKGAQVLGIEGREVNYQRALFCKACYELDRLEFRLDDVRNLSRERYGTFDAIVCSGLLYHLTAADAVRLVSGMYEMAEHVVVIDTHVALENTKRYVEDGFEYAGGAYREHEDDLTSAQRIERRRASLDNPTSFWFTRPSLINLLSRTGFASVYECLAPNISLDDALYHLDEEGQRMQADRCTFVALKGARQALQATESPDPDAFRWPEGSLSYAPRGEAGKLSPARRDDLTSPSDGRSPATVVSPDGAWCWFQDPRAVYIEGERRRTYANWITHDGQLQAGAVDHDSGEIERVTIKKKWGRDDHNTGSFLVLPDRRLMIFYARHNRPGLFCRTSSAPESIGRWRSKVCISDAPNLTYSQPVYLSDERRMYVFWRGEAWKPTFSTSIDGKAWTSPRILIEGEGREHPNIRPYVKIASDGKGTIHLALTDGHPRDEPANSIYYLVYREGAFFRADGSPVGTLEDLPICHRNCDPVYRAHEDSGRAWIWDIALDANGYPVMVYTRMPEINDHRYHYARWTGSSWEDYEMVKAGGWFPQTDEGTPEIEPFYSGGLTLDPADPSIVYLSRQEDERFHLERWKTRDGGRSWEAIKLAHQTGARNVRPLVPRGRPGTSPVVLWMRGDYRTFRRFSTEIVMQTVDV